MAHDVKQWARKVKQAAIPGALRSTHPARWHAEPADCSSRKSAALGIAELVGNLGGQFRKKKIGGGPTHSSARIPRARAARLRLAREAHKEKERVTLFHRLSG